MTRIAAVFVICSLLIGCGLGTSQASKGASSKENLEVSALAIREKVEEKEFAQWSVSSTAFTKKISPSKQSEYVTFYENTEEGYTYLDIIIQLTNLKKEEAMSDQFLTVSVVHDEKDSYVTFVTAEDSEGQGFEYANATPIAPEQTTVLHYYASVPEEIANEEKPIKAVITCQDKVYEIVIKE